MATPPTPNFEISESAPFRWRRALPWVVGGLVVAYFYAYFAAMTTGDVEMAECHALESAVTAKNSIPASVSAPGQAAVFCDREIKLPLLSRYEKVYVYGVLDTTAQDGIVATLRNFYQERHAEKMLVQFFAKENWQAWSDPKTGESGGRRGPETPLRSLWIK